jgi:hypothetical protein
VFGAPKSTVWPLLVSVVARTCPIKIVETGSGLLQTDTATLPAGFNNANAGNWVYPPRVFLGTWDGLRVRMTITAIEREPNQTSVDINAQFEAFENNVLKSWVSCQSNGHLENGMLSDLTSELQRN